MTTRRKVITLYEAKAAARVLCRWCLWVPGSSLHEAPGMTPLSRLDAPEPEGHGHYRNREGDQDQTEGEREGEVAAARLDGDGGRHGAGVAADVAADDDDGAD